MMTKSWLVKMTNPQDQTHRMSADVLMPLWTRLGRQKNGLSPGGSLGGKSKYKMKGNRKQQENKKGKTNTQIDPPSTQQSTYASQQEASGKRAKGKGGGKGNAYTKGKGKGKSITASKGAQTQDKIKQWTQTPKTHPTEIFLPKNKAVVEPQKVVSKVERQACTRGLDHQPKPKTIRWHKKERRRRLWKSQRVASSGLKRHHQFFEVDEWSNNR